MRASASRPWRRRGARGRPEIFNTDQGSQFTDVGFTGVLRGHGVAISMDGRGRFADNIFVERLWRSRSFGQPSLGESCILNSNPRGVSLANGKAVLHRLP
jgi:transposase InsO family protein